MKFSLLYKKKVKIICKTLRELNWFDIEILICFETQRFWLFARSWICDLKMKLKINKACDLSSISVLPPQSRFVSSSFLLWSCTRIDIRELVPVFVYNKHVRNRLILSIDAMWKLMKSMRCFVTKLVELSKSASRTDALILIRFFSFVFSSIESIRRLSGVSSGLETSSAFGRSQTASQLRPQQSQLTLSQGISSQHGLFSQFSQNSQDDILTNEVVMHSMFVGDCMFKRIYACN